MRPLPRGGEEEDEGAAGQGQPGPDLQVLSSRLNLSVCERFSLDSELPSVATWKGPVGGLIAISPSSLVLVYLSLFRIYYSTDKLLGLNVPRSPPTPPFPSWDLR